MVALIDSLESSGMVVRVKDSVDRRRYAVSLTEDGRERLHTDLYAVDRQVADWFLEGVSQADCDHLLTTLEKLIEGRHSDVAGEDHQAANDTDLSVRR
jgi:DNA-binding MarR family transcriptional regulator